MRFRLICGAACRQLCQDACTAARVQQLCLTSMKWLDCAGLGRVLVSVRRSGSNVSCSSLRTQSVLSSSGGAGASPVCPTLLVHVCPALIICLGQWAQHCST